MFILHKMMYRIAHINTMDHFGFIAPFYDKVFKPGRRDQLFQLIDLPGRGILLDAGGGTGRISQFLCDPFDQVVVADLSIEMLEQAKTKACLDTTCSHSEALPFEDGLFDRIIMVDALHHVCDQAETAQELWRVLKPGGRIVIEEPDVRRIGVKGLAILEKLLGMRSHFLSPPSIANLFDENAETRIVCENFNAWVVIEKPVTNLTQQAIT